MKWTVIIKDIHGVHLLSSMHAFSYTHTMCNPQGMHADGTSHFENVLEPRRGTQLSQLKSGNRHGN